MTNRNSISAQIPDVISAHVQEALLRWIQRRTPPGTDAATVEKITQTALANRPAFFDCVAPQVISHYISAYEEAVVALRDIEKGMIKASRRGSIMDHFLGLTPKLASAAPKPLAAAVPTPPTPININVELKPEIRLAAPARQTIKFDRDDAGKLTGAQVIKS